MLTQKLLLLSWLLLAFPAPAGAVSFTFDYSFDTNGFFASQERRDSLEQAAADLGSRFGDELAPIVPGGANAWTARFTDPSTGGDASAADLRVPEASLYVFVGARELGPGALGFASPGTASVIGSLDWFDTVQYRGQSGAAAAHPTDFGPWGGFVSFDLDTAWHFGPTTDGLDALEVDFYSVVMHELAHVMGFGLAPSWREQIALGRFFGPYSVDAFGSTVPLSAEQEHWAETIGDALMTPLLSAGQRQILTELDQAGLRDTGWQSVSEPTTLALILTPLAILARRRIRLR